MVISMASKSSKKNKKEKGEKTKLVKTKTSKINKKTKTISDYSTSVLQSQKLSSESVIGTFGSILTFTVSSDKVNTFSDMTRTVTGRWITHESIKKKEKTEFLGAGLDTISMSITLDKGLGTNPGKVIKKIEKAIKQGKVERLIIGGEKVGTRKYRITEMTEAWDVVMLNGVLCKATLDVTFEEYVG